MLEFPISKETFKKSFLGGGGSFEVTTPQGTWEALVSSDSPFPDTAESLAKLSLRAGSKFQFGEPDNPKGLKLNADITGSASSEIRLIRSKTDPLIKSYGLQEYLSDGTLYAAVLLGAAADAKMDGGLPVGPLTNSFGIKAGGSVTYERLVPFKKTDSARAILADIFSRSRLPQAVNSAAEIPAEGEVLALRYGGYLGLSAGLSWGYSFSGTKSIDVLDFGAALKYSGRAAASVSFKYRLAGEFSSEARRAKGSDWVRYVVRKSRESSTEFAADIGLEVSADLEGLPESPDKLLAALLGTSARGVLDRLAEIEQNASLEELQEKLGKLVSGFVLRHAEKWIDKALDDATVSEFLARAHEVVDAYENLGDRVVGLYEDFLDGKLPRLSELLDTVLGFEQKGREALQDLTDGEVWGLIRLLAGERFNDLLLRDAEFKQFIGLAKKVKAFVDGGKGRAEAILRELVADLKMQFPLDGLFGELAKYDEPAELKKLADDKIKGLVAVVIGKAFDELKSNDDFKKAAQQIKAAHEKLVNFRDAYRKNLKKAVHQNFAASVAFAYKRAVKGEALLDVEVNLGHEDGAALAQQASRGNFRGLLDLYKPDVVRINKSKLTHELTTSAQVQVTIWNWKYRHLAEVIQHSEHSVEAAPGGGLLHVYSIDTSAKETTEKSGWDKFKETVKTNFTLSVVGHTFQPQGAPSAGPNGVFLVETLEKMAVSYDLLYEDEQTNPTELTQYLALAEELKLGPGSTVMVRDLTRQFPNPPGLGKVSVNYAVRYNDAAVRAAFLLYDVVNKANEADRAILEGYVRDTARLLVSAKFTGGRANDKMPPVGFAYTSSTVYTLYRKSGSEAAFRALSFSGAYPEWFAIKSGTKKWTLTDTQKTTLFTFYQVEDFLVKRLINLCAAVQKAHAKETAVPEKELREAAEGFLEVSEKLNNKGGENTFFAAFDRLVQKAVASGGVRESTMIVEVTPPDAKTLPSGEKEKVVKFLTA